jgi:DNA-binding CsgD family transcriptional regulator
MVVVAMNEGDLERARALGEESLALGRQADAAQGIVWSLLTLAIAATLRADYERAERLYAEGLSLSRELDSAYWRFLYFENWGWTALLQGDPERATVLIEEAVELARERRRGFMGLLSRPLDNLGWAALLGGELGRAKAQFGENLTLSKGRGDKGTLLMSLEGLACVVGAEGEALRAARLFGAAESLQEAVDYRLVPQERAVLEPYRASVRSGLGEAAWEKAVAEGGATGLDQATAYALSKERSSKHLSPTRSQPPVSSTPEHPGGLSPREVEVLGLVAEGLTNAQVAQRLFLSPRTVQRHLNSVYHKIGSSTRAEAARFASAMWADLERSLALTAERLGTDAVPAGPRRRIDPGAIGSLVACAPLDLLPSGDTRIVATADLIRSRFMLEDGRAFYQGISHTGLGTYLTLQLAAVELRDGDRCARRSGGRRRGRRAAAA